ncbi:FliA/WhiG family RNA polymerase sigma factor [Nitrospira defluvii]|nr:FliA/WhiG family RNA polymerase sigma factor [Nitrospira defluvii]
MLERNKSTALDKSKTAVLLEEFAPMIRLIAQRLAFRLPPSLDVEDLIHAGVIGFMDAFERYDPSISTRFKTYAEFRIRGSMLDEIRALNWIPRSVYDKATKLRKACEGFIKENGRPPTEEELIEVLQMSQEAFDTFLYQASGATLLSLEDLGIKEGSEWHFIESMADPRSENPLLSLLTHDNRERLMQAIEALPKKECLVISLYYDDELTMKEIGKVLKVTESRVCQLHAKAIMQLKGMLGKK